MAFSYTKDPSGIKYNNIPSSGLTGLNYKPRYGNNDFEYADEDGIKTFINAVELNWNGAQVSGKTLNTTGEMLSILQTAYNYATTYTGKTSLTSSSVLGTINGQSLKFGGSITIETGSDYTHPTFSGVTGSYGTSAAKTLAHSGTFSVPYITVNNNGHITAAKSITLTLPAAPTTVTGNAGTATKLATARKLTIGSTGKTFDGSADVAWTLTEIGAAATSHKHTYTDVGAAAASHTHTYTAVGAAAANHTHTYTAVGAAAANHTHTYSAIGAAAKNHQHTEYANAVHEHSNYAIKSHASSATTYGVGTSANYGHLKISSTYATYSVATDIALSLGGAYNMYKAFVTRISELAAEITALKTRVTTLEGYHATKPVTAVTVTPESITLYGKGETYQLSYAITPTDASNKTVTWTSSATGFATVSAGKVTTVAKGSATITATANDGSGKKDTCAVTVSEARITAVNAGSDITVTYGSSISRIVPTQTIQSGDGAVFTAGYTYTRTSGSSVTVNNGALTIVSAGTSEITVKSNADNTKSDVVKVTVNKASDTVTIKEGSTAVGTTLSKTYGNSLTLTATTKSGNAVTWNSSDKTVATINNGVVTILKTGTTTITANVAASTNYNAASDTVALTVNAASQSITLSPTSLSWSASDTLSAKKINVSGNKGTISASSNNTNVTATVSGSIVTVTPKAYNQNATITITANAVSGKYSASASKTATVTVAAQATKYYWYAGWTEPTAANIATIINETYPSAKGSTTMNPAGKTATSTSGIIMDYTVANLYNANAKAQYYFVVPNGQGIYDILGTKLHLDDAAFTVHSSTAIANHTIYISTPTGRTISAIIK